MSEEKKSAQVLDCTIRDGSYLINYQFTAEDTYLLTSALCEAGIERIEVGHGLGLDAQVKGKGKAAEVDIRYVNAGVSAAAGRARIGVFYIPGIGTLDSIRQAADAGIGFLRVGTNVDQFAEGEAAIRLAKDLGLEVWSNLMKSYVASPKEFGEVCRHVEGFGADVAVLVDSAGGMIPDQIRNFTQEALAVVGIPLGFHGHNNLDLVIANCLAFVQQGGRYVDASLRGMGRSAGNAATEVLSALLVREGFDIGNIDFRQLMCLAQNLVAPGMPRDTGLLPAEIASGIACFHSSFQPLVDKASAEVGVEAFETILELPVASRAAVLPEMADSAAKKAKARHASQERRLVADEQWVHRATCSTLDELRAALQVLSAKTRFPVVVSMARTRGNGGSSLRIAPIRIGQKYCIGHVESGSPEQDAAVWDCFGAEVAYWMVDRQIPAPVSLPSSSLWLAYDDDQLLITALDDLLRVSCSQKRIYCPDSEERIVKLALPRLAVSSAAPWDVGVALSVRRPFTRSDVDCIQSGGMLILVQPDAIESEAIIVARERGLLVLRLDLREALVAEVSRLFNTQLRLDRHAGRRVLANATVVAGGVVGNPGEIVVNSISVPTIILGKADGVGGIVPFGPEDEAGRRAVLEWMLQPERGKPS